MSRHELGSIAAVLVFVATGCNNDVPVSATTEVTSLGLRITVTRVATHPFLARYNLKLTVQTRSGCSASDDLFPDTGGVSRRNVYVGDAGRVYVVGQFDVRVFDAGACAVALMEFRQLEAGLQFVGTFDSDDDRRWTFIPSMVRPEQSFERF